MDNQQGPTIKNKINISVFIRKEITIQYNKGKKVSPDGYGST